MITTCDGHFDLNENDEVVGFKLTIKICGEEVDTYQCEHLTNTGKNRIADKVDDIKKFLKRNNVQTINVNDKKTVDVLTNIWIYDWMPAFNRYNGETTLWEKDVCLVQ